MAKSPGAKPRILAIVLLALIVRLAIVWLTLRAHSAYWFFGQATELARLADSLRSGQGLSSPFGCCTGPSAFLAPGYPAIVAVFFAVFHPYSYASTVAVMIFQALCGAATVFTLMLLAHRIFAASASNIAGLIWALSPPAIFLPTLFWETSLSILLATVLIYLAVECALHPTLPRWLLAGLVSAIAIAVNPSLLPIILCCFGWTFYRTRRQPPTWPVCAALVCLLLSTPWIIRNFHQLHAFIPLRSNLGYELWQGNRPGGNGFFTPALHPNVSTQEFTRYRALGEVAYMREKLEMAKDAIRANPARFLALTCRRAIYFWTGIVEHPSSVIVAYVVLTTLGGFAGLFLLWRRARQLAWCFLPPLLFFPLPYYLTHPDFRFRLVLDPLLVALTAYALTRNEELLDLQHVPQLNPALRDAAGR